MGEGASTEGGVPGDCATSASDIPGDRTATGRRERWKELSPPDPAGFVEFGVGPKGVCVTPDFRFYAYSFYTDLESLRTTELGKSWWK